MDRDNKAKKDSICVLEVIGQIFTIEIRYKTKAQSRIVNFKGWCPLGGPQKVVPMIARLAPLPIIHEIK